MALPPTDRFSQPSIALHWLTLALLIGVYACMELREFWPKGSETREALKAWHYTLGLTVFLLTLVRIVARFAGVTPAIAPTPPAWQRSVAKIMHLALYVFLFAMPIAGWLILSAEGDPVRFWGLELPALIGPNESLEDFLEEVHEAGGTAGYILIGLHATAALFHHYALRDNTLVRILPGRRRSA